MQEADLHAGQGGRVRDRGWSFRILWAFDALIALVVLYFNLNRIVKTSVERLGPKVLQAPVTLDGVKLSPFSGNGSLTSKDLNPEAFRF